MLKKILFALPLILIATVSHANDYPLFIKKDILRGVVNRNVGYIQVKAGLPLTNTLDEVTQNYVKEQQIQLGLEPTGVIDPITWLNLIDRPESWENNVKEDYIRNWERVIDKQFDNYIRYGQRKFIVVNIPSMRLKAFETNGQPLDKEDFLSATTEVFTDKVIVGKPYSQTPLKDINITGIKYNPTWTPTPNMVKNLGDNIDWVKSHNLKIYDKQGEVNIEDYEASIMMGANPLSYRFTQPPGPSNALGLLKFETDSNDNIYLHDTNNKKLFNTNNRIYSAGCIRVNDYLWLSSFVLEDTQEQIISNIENGRTYIQRVPQKVPVYFLNNEMDYVAGNLLYFPKVYK